MIITKSGTNLRPNTKKKKKKKKKETQFKGKTKTKNLMGTPKFSQDLFPNTLLYGEKSCFSCS